MKKMIVLALSASALVGSLALLAETASARSYHHRRVALHRGERTYPVVAGTNRIRINSVGQVILLRDTSRPTTGMGTGQTPSMSPPYKPVPGVTPSPNPAAGVAPPNPAPGAPPPPK